MRSLGRILLHALYLLVLLLVPASLASHSLEADVVARLEYVVDGDTLRVVVLAACNPRYESLVGFEGRVRLADINAPEVYTREGLIAKHRLASLLADKPILYIDVDDVYVYDKYGRVVGIVLAPYNETHLLNVNEWLLEQGLAEPRDYPNEFRPGWPLYVPASIAERCRVSAAGQANANATHAKTRTVTKWVTAWRTITKTMTVTETVTEWRPHLTLETITVTVTKWRGVDATTVLVAALATLATTVAGFILGRAAGRRG